MFSASVASVDIPTGKDYLSSTSTYVSDNPPTINGILKFYPQMFTDAPSITIPARIKVIKVSWNIYSIYVGVTPGKQYQSVGVITEYRKNTSVKWCCLVPSTTMWMRIRNDSADFFDVPVVSWSPEINNQTPTVTDY